MTKVLDYFNLKEGQYIAVKDGVACVFKNENWGALGTAIVPYTLDGKKIDFPIFGSAELKEKAIGDKKHIKDSFKQWIKNYKIYKL